MNASGKSGQLQAFITRLQIYANFTKINEINTIYVENMKKNIIICIEKCRIGENFFAWTEVFCGYSAIAARSKHFAKKSI